MPVDNPDSHETEPSFALLHQALGEPELTVYPACNRGEATQIREKAKALRYFSGVINLTVQGCGDIKNDDKLASMVNPIHSGGNEPDMKEETPSYTKWVIISKKEDIVRRCLDIYEECFTG